MRDYSVSKHQTYQVIDGSGLDGVMCFKTNTHYFRIIHMIIFISDA